MITGGDATLSGCVIWTRTTNHPDNTRQPVALLWHLDEIAGAFLKTSYLKIGSRGVKTPVFEERPHKLKILNMSKSHLKLYWSKRGSKERSEHRGEKKPLSMRLKHLHRLSFSSCMVPYFPIVPSCINIKLK